MINILKKEIQQQQNSIKKSQQIYNDREKLIKLQQLENLNEVEKENNQIIKQIDSGNIILQQYVQKLEIGQGDDEIEQEQAENFINQIQQTKQEQQQLKENFLKQNYQIKLIKTKQSSYINNNNNSIQKPTVVSSSHIQQTLKEYNKDDEFFQDVNQGLQGVLKTEKQMEDEFDRQNYVINDIDEQFDKTNENVKKTNDKVVKLTNYVKNSNEYRLVGAIIVEFIILVILVIIYRKTGN